MYLTPDRLGACTRAAASSNVGATGSTTSGKVWVQLDGLGVGVPFTPTAVTTTLRPLNGTVYRIVPGCTCCPSTLYWTPATSGMVRVELRSSKTGSVIARGVAGAVGVGLGVGAAKAAGASPRVSRMTTVSAPMRRSKLVMRYS